MSAFEQYVAFLSVSSGGVLHSKLPAVPASILVSQEHLEPANVRVEPTPLFLTFFFFILSSFKSTKKHVFIHLLIQ